MGSANDAHAYADRGDGLCWCGRPNEAVMHELHNAAVRYGLVDQEPSLAQLEAVELALEQAAEDKGYGDWRDLDDGELIEFIAAGWARPAIAYDRARLVETITYHWLCDSNEKGCGCGWNELGRSQPEHVVDVYEQSMLAVTGPTAPDGEGEHEH